MSDPTRPVSVCALSIRTTLLTASVLVGPWLATERATPAMAARTPASVVAARGGATARPASRAVHRAVVTCDFAPFYVWPDRSSAPTGTAYPPARRGEGFDVIGDGTLAYGALTLYETTIDVFQPFGAGQHYWIPAACINAS
ncbi:MAG: hypothetical protein NVS1B2_06380 [Vulcanimicrobiaceae bacterium]